MGSSVEGMIGAENETAPSTSFISNRGPSLPDHAPASVRKEADKNLEDYPPYHSISSSPGFTGQAGIGDSPRSGATNTNINTNTTTDGSTDISNGNTGTNDEFRITINHGDAICNGITIITSGTVSRRGLMFDRGKIIKIFLVIVAQAALTLSTNGSTTTGSSSHLSRFAKILLEFAKVCNVVALISFLYAIFVCHLRHRAEDAARLLTGIGVVATTYGILAVICMELVENEAVQVAITAVIFVACVPVLIEAFQSY